MVADASETTFAKVSIGELLFQALIRLGYIALRVDYAAVAQRTEKRKYFRVSQTSRKGDGMCWSHG